MNPTTKITPTLRPFTEEMLSNGKPLESPDFEGSRLSDLLAERTGEDKAREYELSKKIDAALLFIQEKKPMSGADWEFMKIVLMGYLS